MNRILFFLMIALAVNPARAIELSLEENRAERGSVGFVDMQRLFKNSPDANKAREGFDELVRQAEERVNVRKSDLQRLRQELDRLRLDRDALAKSTPTVSAPPQPATAAPTPPVAAAVTPTPAAPAITSISSETVPAKTETSSLTQQDSQPLTINLPGLTEGPIALERPGGSPLNPTRNAAASAVVPPSTPQAAPTPPPATPAAIAAPPIDIAKQLLEFDGRIVAKQAEIDRAQSELDRERQSAERSLLDAEGRKTDQVLGRLYRAIAEVAKRDGVSVVIDKSATLYGHPAVDLTDKVLKQLRGGTATP